MRIRLHGEQQRIYLEIRRSKMRSQMPDKRRMTDKPRIRKCHLCSRQRKKLEEMTLEGFS